MFMENPLNMFILNKENSKCKPSNDKKLPDCKVISIIKDDKGFKKFPNGDYYEGEFKNFIIHGKGKHTFANGNIYEGNFDRDKFHGEGKYIFAGGDIYEGNFDHNEFCGKGKYIFADGNIYEGNFDRDKFYGEGKYIFADGRIYEGEFRRGRMYHGKMISPNKIIYYHNFQHVSIYEGELDGDKKCGYGELYSIQHRENILNITKPLSRKSKIYIGYFNNDQMNGYGTMFYSNNETYKGNFENKKRHGYGKYTDHVGNIWEGTWENNRKIKKISWWNSLFTNANSNNLLAECALCATKLKPKRLFSFCGKSNCLEYVCENCINKYYDENKPGSRSLNLKCPFCRRFPINKQTTYIDQKLQHFIKDDIDIQDLGWCFSCSRFKKVPNECGTGNKGNFICDECDIKNYSGTKQCPKCLHAVIKINGCNHITCPCGMEWCWRCGKFQGTSRTSISKLDCQC